MENNKISLQEIKKNINLLALQEHELQSAIVEAKEIIVVQEDEIEDLRHLQEGAQIVASAIQKRAHEKISRIVNKCLSTIFDDPYEFEILFERKRNKTEAHIVFKRDGNVLEDPMEEGGGGAVDVAAFALRLAAIILSKPKKRKLLVLDEPFKFVSKKYRPRIGKLLQELSEGYGVQIVMVTHIDELKTGTICQL